MRARSAVMGVAAAALLLGGGAQTAFAEEVDYARPGPYLSVGFSWGKEAIDVDDIQGVVSDARIEEQFEYADTCSSSSPVFKCDTKSLIDRQDSPGADVRVGYRINEIFAAELNFQYFDEYKIILGGGDLKLTQPLDPTAPRGFTVIQSGNQDIASITAYNFFANMRAYPWTGVLQPYGLLGIGGVYADVDTKEAQVRVLGDEGHDAPQILGGSDSDLVFAGKIGGGLDYYFTEHIVLNIDVSWILTTGVEIDTLPANFKLNQVPITTSLMYRF